MSDPVLFDIDGTLFDPEHFGRLIRAEFTKILKVGEEDLIRANADYYAKLESNADFKPREITAHLAREFKGDQGELDRVFWENDGIYKESLFGETEEVVKKLSHNHILGIFSQGNEDLQTRKLEASGIKKYFKPEYVFIHARKLTDDAIELLPRSSTLIDNHHDVVLALKDFVSVIWINRKTEDSDPQIKTIHTLADLTNDN